MKKERKGHERILPTNPLGSTRARTSLIFVIGLLLLIVATTLVAFWINDSLRQEEALIEVLDDLSARAAGWDGQVFDEPGASLPGAAAFQATLNDLRLEALMSPEDHAPLRLWVRGEPTLASSLESAQTALLALQEGRATLSARPDDAAREVILRQEARLQQSLAEAAQTIMLEQQSNVGMIRGLFGALFFSSMIFLLIGLWFTQQIVILQVETLDQVAQRITAGDLDTPVEIHGHGEFLDLAVSFETMRCELRESRERFRRWTADLEAHVARRTQELSALSQVIAVASHSFEQGVVFRSVLEQAVQVMGVETGGLWLLKEETDRLDLAAACGMEPASEERVRTLSADGGAPGRAAQSGLTIVLEDTAQVPPSIASSATQEGYRSCVAAPIRTRDRVTGVLAVMTRNARSFTPDEVALLTSIGQQIGVALDNIRLLGEVREQTQQVASLQERQRIGLELHDGLLQTLGYLCLKTDQIEAQAAAQGKPGLAHELDAQRHVLETASSDVRRFIANLSNETPPAPPAPLQAALSLMARSFRDEAHLPVELAFDGPPLLMPPDRTAHLVRIAREALSNAAHHGGATSATLACSRVDGHGELVVLDNGRGFDPAHLPADGRDHFGLNVMRARAARIGGDLSIESAPGKGTRVRIVWPLQVEEGSA